MTRLLLDSNILIPLLDGAPSRLPFAVRSLLEDPAHESYFSVASVWEIAIKVRLGKLPLVARLDEIPDRIEQLGLLLLAVELHHALADPLPLPATRDPFDRLLLAQCAVENMRLVTVDRALVVHPLAFR